MAEEFEPSRKRAKLVRDELAVLSKEEIIERCIRLEEKVCELEALEPLKELTAKVEELQLLRDSEEKLKQQQVDSTKRENILVMQLTTKDKKIQDHLNEIQDLKAAQSAGPSQLRSMLLDPAINLMFTAMRKEMDSLKEKHEQAQSDLAAWKFTADSQTGKRLMAKCRMLFRENEELGKQISSGRTAKLESEIALEKTLVDEMKTSQKQMDDFLLELDEDVAGMQSTVYFLQQQLKETKDRLNQTATDYETLKVDYNLQQQTISDLRSNTVNKSHRTSNGNKTNYTQYSDDNDEGRHSHLSSPASPPQSPNNRTNGSTSLPSTGDRTESMDTTEEAAHRHSPISKSFTGTGLCKTRTEGDDVHKRTVDNTNRSSGSPEGDVLLDRTGNKLASLNSDDMLTTSQHKPVNRQNGELITDPSSDHDSE